jgi:hypothetical protein
MKDVDGFFGFSIAAAIIIPRTARIPPTGAKPVRGNAAARTIDSMLLVSAKTWCWINVPTVSRRAACKPRTTT